MIDNEGIVYYDRVTINNIYGQGLHFTNNLVPLYYMINYF